MNSPPYQPLEWLGNRLRWIDQTALPGVLRYRESDKVGEIEGAIQRLEIRGAPLIGIAARYAAALAIAEIAPEKSCRELTVTQIERIRAIGRVRPTAVNLQNSVTGLLREFGKAPDECAYDKAVAAANDLLQYERAACKKIAEAGADILPNDGAVLTHCNTGPLATGGIGTALGAIILAVKESGKHLHVFATETGPLRQGARLTVWELQQWGIPVTLVPDTAASSLLRSNKVQAVIVGADRVACNGDFANKIGTVGLAASAHLATIPFYTAFPWTTIDDSIADGTMIPIEYRDSDEVISKLPDYSTSDRPEVWNPAFDVTPGNWVTTYITDRGAFNRARFTTYLAQQSC